MIELQKVRRDVVNYGTLKVYTTFLTISEDEVDPELFNASQLKEIFNSRFDTIKININFVQMQEGEYVSVAKELLVFKLSKCSDNEVSYMSNVDDEGKLSSLVLTKSEDEVSLDVVEYSVGGSASGGLEIIEWNESERELTVEEFNKLKQLKAILYASDYYYYPYWRGEQTIDLSSMDVYADAQAELYGIILTLDPETQKVSSEQYHANVTDPGTILYKHDIVIDNEKFQVISDVSTPFSSVHDILINNHGRFISVSATPDVVNNISQLLINADGWYCIKNGALVNSLDGLNLENFTDRVTRL